ncbi:MAG: PAS domain-containing protein [Synechococcales cyanobacterium T60_A2020_003]|nr:PAS domain-containing protein [Synechococcales cyanobacterium T60_A2020_003]
MGDGAIATDCQGQITFMNPVAEALTGWTAVESIRNGKGEVIGGILVFQDVTKRQQAEERSREFRALVDHSPDVIARFDRQLRYLYIHPNMQTATGIPSQAFIGRTNADLFMPADVVLPWNFALTQALNTAQEQLTELDRVTVDGVRSYPVRIVPEVNDQNVVESLLSVARDVTAYKWLASKCRYTCSKWCWNQRGSFLIRRILPSATSTFCKRSAIAQPT